MNNNNIIKRKSSFKGILKTAIKKCLRPESNWRHMDFQSIALPTELPRHTERVGNRTRDNLIKSQVLYRLSYTP